MRRVFPVFARDTGPAETVPGRLDSVRCIVKPGFTLGHGQCRESIREVQRHIPGLKALLY